MWFVSVCADVYKHVRARRHTRASERAPMRISVFFSVYHYKCAHACAYILERACTPHLRVHAYGWGVGGGGERGRMVGGVGGGDSQERGRDGGGGGGQTAGDRVIVS